MDSNNLVEMSAEQRQAHYKQFFGKQVEPLKFISTRDIYNEHSDLWEEIVEAYLQHTTFSVGDWVNYDAAVKKFYIDQRVDTCGKLDLPEKMKRKLAAGNQADIEFAKVRIEFGTPFRTLGHVNITTVPGKLGVGQTIRARILSVSSEALSDHPMLFNFVESVRANEIDGVGLEYGQKGLQYSDLQQIARLFRQDPSEMEMAQINRCLNVKGWFQFSEPRENNPGYVDGLSGGNTWNCSSWR